MCGTREDGDSNTFINPQLLKQYNARVPQPRESNGYSSYLLNIEECFCVFMLSLFTKHGVCSLLQNGGIHTK